MLIEDVLHIKGHVAVKVRAQDRVSLAALKLAEYRIGALIVEDQ